MHKPQHLRRISVTQKASIAATNAKFSGNAETAICKHCMRDHTKDPCMICDNSGHAPQDCPDKCEYLIQSRPIICRRPHHDCLELSTPDDGRHVCIICAKVWRVLHCEAPSKRGIKPHRMCDCGGYHFTHQHSRKSCAMCNTQRINMIKSGIVDFTEFDSKPCHHTAVIKRINSAATGIL